MPCRSRPQRKARAGRADPLADPVGPACRDPSCARVAPARAGHPIQTDPWRCRFKAVDGRLAPECVPDLLVRLLARGLPALKTENLYRFDGQPGYSVAQGE